MKALIIAAVSAATLVGSLAPADAVEQQRRRNWNRDRGVETTIIRKKPGIDLGVLLALGMFGGQKQQQEQFYDEPRQRNPIPLK